MGANSNIHQGTDKGAIGKLGDGNMFGIGELFVRRGPVKRDSDHGCPNRVGIFLVEGGDNLVNEGSL